MEATFTGNSEVLSSEFVERTKLRLEKVGVKIIDHQNHAWREPMLDLEGKCHIGENEIARAVTHYVNERKDEEARVSAAN